MDYRILIVEDEPKLRGVLCDYFASKQDLPVSTENGIRALEFLEQQEFDAVLLDIMMPQLDGFSVCRAARKTSDVPIIFLTALSDEEDKLYGYELGADDYITKPFSLSVLYAKVTALIRRRRGNLRTADRLEAGELSVHLPSRRVFAGKEEISAARLNLDFFNLESDLTGSVYIQDAADTQNPDLHAGLTGSYRLYGQVSFEYYLEISLRFGFLPLDN